MHGVKRSKQQLANLQTVVAGFLDSCLTGNVTHGCKNSLFKVNVCGLKGRLLVQQPDVLHAVKGNPHPNLEKHNKEDIDQSTRFATAHEISCTD